MSRHAVGLSARLMVVMGLALVGLCAYSGGTSVKAQQSPAPIAPPAAPQPVSPPSTQPPAVPQAQPATPPASIAPAPQAAEHQPRDIAPKPVLRLRGQSTWDEGFASIRKAILALREEAGKLNLAGEGAPLAHFIDSDDLGFTFEAMLPLAALPTAPPTLPRGYDLAQSPAGRALVFPHEGAYDELDAAYEAITALLDEKGFAATGTFLEEYQNLPEKPDDPSLKLSIIVFLR